MLYTSSEELGIVVDVGNTTTSATVFDGDKIIEVSKVLSSELVEDIDVQQLLLPLLGNYERIRYAVVCSVVPHLEIEIMSMLDRKVSSYASVLLISSSLRLPFTLHYDSPSSFGADRLALCAWGVARFPNAAVIALDVGTAITVDVLSSQREYLGGLIMPGLDLMVSALSKNTAQLPSIKLECPEMLLGTSTETCINNGIVLGCASALDGIIKKLKTWLTKEKHETTIVVLLTGGNAALLQSLLHHRVVIDEHAVTQGARYLLMMNR